MAKTEAEFIRPRSILFDRETLSAKYRMYGPVSHREINIECSREIAMALLRRWVLSYKRKVRVFIQVPGFVSIVPTTSEYAVETSKSRTHGAIYYRCDSAEAAVDKTEHLLMRYFFGEDVL